MLAWGWLGAVPSPAGSYEVAATFSQANTAETWTHWAFQPLKRPPVPSVKRAAWSRNPIDAFILSKLESVGLEPTPSADKLTLIRRVTFDLTGLPPTPAAVDTFLADSAPDSIDRLVDRLLGDPAYGERWAQHWLDLARFAETDGFEHDKVRPQAWRYRDWVIDALNADLPYDQFVSQQLAGDELRPGDSAATLATGFAMCGPDMPDINLQDERRNMILNELIGTIGAVFLGLQMECAQCHDHKFDPIGQVDFYRLRAFFDNVELFTEHKFGRVLRESSGPPRSSYLLIRGDFRRPGDRVEPGFPKIADPHQTQSRGESRPVRRRTDLVRWMTDPDHPLTGRVLVNRLWQHHFGEGLVRTPSDFGIAGDAPSHPDLLDWLATELPRRRWSLKAMHRLLLTSATYAQASRPGNERHAWDRDLANDLQNRLLGRMNRKRLDGEALRDAMLFASGRLNRARGGPGVMTPLPKELERNLQAGHWRPSPNEADHYRRSVYLFVRRNLRYPLFQVFDRPDTNASCPKRSRSIIAPQALELLNSEFALTTARHLAGTILADAHQSNDRLELLYRRALSRPPTPVEFELLTSFLTRQARQLRDDGRPPTSLALPIPSPPQENPYDSAAWTDVCLAVINSSEFVYVD
jgi:hypothetical protein